MSVGDRSPRIKTTTVGSYPLPDWLIAAPSEQTLVDATRVVIATQEQAGIDVVCDDRRSPNRFDQIASSYSPISSAGLR